MSQYKTHVKGRRVFLRLASLFGISAGSSILSSFFTGCESDTTKSTDDTYQLDISTIESLAETGGTAKVSVGDNNNGRKVVVIRSGSSEFVVMTSVCTHQGCEVNLPDEKSGNLFCPCHNSEFSVNDGKVLKGPAESPLRTFDNRFDSGKNTLSITF